MSDKFDSTEAQLVRLREEFRQLWARLDERDDLIARMDVRIAKQDMEIQRLKRRTTDLEP